MDYGHYGIHIMTPEGPGVTEVRRCIESGNERSEFPEYHLALDKLRAGNEYINEYINEAYYPLL
jgi:hypothetical protein